MIINTSAHLTLTNYNAAGKSEWQLVPKIHEYCTLLSLGLMW
jgi:hypothetical protein